MGKWSTRLEEDIKLFHVDVEGIQKLAEDPQLLEDHEDLAFVLGRTQELKDMATDLEKQAKKNQAFQQVFGQQVERYPQLEEAVQDINLKKAMWEARRDVTTVT
eukprot:3613343-Rhodomonas_salina.1